MCEKTRHHPLILELVMLAAVASLAGACSSEVSNPPSHTLDRPSDVAFGCLSGSPDDNGLGRTVPLSGCMLQYTLDGPPDAGVGAGCGGDAGPCVDAGPMADAGPGNITYALVLQQPRGEVAVVNLGTGVVDSDPLIPGYNGLPVGDLPVEIATTADGCFAVTANQGSCDLGEIEIHKAVLQKPGAVQRQFVNALGGVVAARPAALVAPPPPPLVDLPFPDCTDMPAGFVFVAYPTCHMVGVVNLADGSLAQTIRFAPGATPDAAPLITLGGNDVTCPVECNELATSAAVGPGGDGFEPSALVMDADGTRLYVGAWNASHLAIVTLGATGLGEAATTVPLEDAIGVSRMAVSGDVAMGGYPDPDPGPTVAWPHFLGDGAGGVHRFLYAVARDRTVRVVDVTLGQAAVECDTQVDPRIVGTFGAADVPRLSCLPVGDPLTPRRRAGVKGPGIVLPNGAVPLDVNFLRSYVPPPSADKDPAPDDLNGVFAIITGEGPIDLPPRGAAYYVTVDDDNYPDHETPGKPSQVETTLIIPHTLRDDVAERGRVIDSKGCLDSGYATRADGPVRNSDDPVQNMAGFLTGASPGLAADLIDPTKPPPRIAPSLHRVQCDATHALYETSSVLRILDPNPPAGPNDNPPADTDLTADPANFAPLRERVFADLAHVKIETLAVTWQGALADDRTFSRPPGAEVSVEGNLLRLVDGGGLFCEVGAEVGDIVSLHGCDSDSDCSADQACVVHAETPAGVPGLCLPVGSDTLRETCKNVLISRRRYTAVEVGVDHVLLAPRPVVLDETPLEGCTPDTPDPADVDECDRIFQRVRSEADPDGMLDLPQFDFACAADAAMGGPDRCIMTCASNDDCAGGSVCDGARCVLGALPPPECYAPLQQYELFAGEAFVLKGSQTGYVHDIVVDPATNMCIHDPAASPYDIGRFHRSEPACTEDTILTDTPNPCAVELLEPVDAGGTLALRPTHAIRIRNRGLRLDIVDVVIDSPDAPGKRYSPAPDGYGFTFDLGGGFNPRVEAVSAFLPERIRQGPDGSLWITDAGDSSSATGVRGQLIRFTAAPDPVDESPPGTWD